MRSAWAFPALALLCLSEGTNSTNSSQQALLDERCRAANVSQEEQRWCCASLQLSCEFAFNCSEVSLSWEGKQWCCRHQNLSCAWNCTHTENLSSWEAAQRAYCCRHDGIACVGTSTSTATPGSTLPLAAVFDCDVEGHWSKEKQDWCCEHKALGCSLPADPAEEWDCTKGLDNWEVVFSEAKKQRCCRTHGVACPLGTSTSTALESTRSRTTTSTAPESTSQAALPAVDVFDCHVDVAERWSKEKHDWCCQHKELGCPLLAGHEDEAAPATSPEQLLEEFDCKEGFDNWELGFSEAKKEWCCRHHAIACPVATSTSMEEFDCKEGFDNWELGFSEAKKEWCCRHHAMACPVETSTSMEEFDCKEGFASWEKGFSNAKKEWCCRQHAIACPVETSTSTEEFDCKEGFDNWELGFSEAKKEWCCGHHAIACPVETPTSTAAPTSTSQAALPSTSFDCYEDVPAHWPKEKQDWCCQHKERGCLAGQEVDEFDCNDGLANWELGFSAAKKAWCCKHYWVACPNQEVVLSTSVAPFDCEEDYESWLWSFSEAKKEWCCHSYGLACEKDPKAKQATPKKFDCSGSPEDWPLHQLTWCCSVESRGCLQMLQQEMGESFDCMGFSDDWSDEKQNWCCFNKGIGCKSEATQERFTSHGSDWSDEAAEREEDGFFYLIIFCLILGLVISYCRAKGICGFNNDPRSYSYGRGQATSYGRGAYATLGSRYQPPSLP